MTPTDPTPAWAPPDPPRSAPPDLSPPPGELPALPTVDGAEGPGRARLTTVLLAGITAVALVAFGCLGTVLLPLTRPDRPVADGPPAESEPSDEPAGSRAPADPPSSAAAPSPTYRPASTPSSGPGRFTVAYAVTGQGPADILYRDADGQLVQLEKVTLPWRRTIRTDDPARASVQAGKAEDKGGRTISCALSIDGGTPLTESVGPTGWRCACGG